MEILSSSMSTKIRVGMMAKPSVWRPLFAARSFTNLQNARVFLKPPTPAILSPRPACFSSAKRKVNVKSERSRDSESVRVGSKCPRPESVAWQKELANTVQLIGYINKPVEYKHTEAGKAFAWTSLAFKPSESQETTWFRLKFFEELAKIAAEHVKACDHVYVSGSLDFEKADGEDNNLCAIPQVCVNTLSFVEHEHPFPQSEVVNASVQNKEAKVNLSTSELPFKKNRYNSFGEHERPFPQSEDVNASVQNKEAEVKLSTSGKKTTMDAASTEKLWQEFFAKPDDWWDNRENKKNYKYPDFKHKNKNEVLWVVDFKNPSWVKSRLDALDERKHEERQANDADGGTQISQIGKKTITDTESTEKLWQAFFMKPDEWWDNRKDKKNPKSPDFKHKDTGEALWVVSYKNPSWVKSQLDILDKKLKDSHQFTRSQESLSSFADRDLMF